MNMAHTEAVALRKIGSPHNFKWFRYECIGPDAIKLTGCVTTQVYVKGPKAGRPKYEGEKQIAIVVEAETAAEALRYQAETGRCGECLGKSEVFASWSHDTGTKFRPCQRCNGTGKAVR